MLSPTHIAILFMNNRLIHFAKMNSILKYVQQRQQLIETIEIYQSADDTNVLDKHSIKFIGDTFEYVHSIDEFES
jgi:hypothetical protein